MIASLPAAGRTRPLQAQARRATTRSYRGALVVRAAETYARDFSKAPRLIQVGGGRQHRQQVVALAVDFDCSHHISSTGTASYTDYVLNLRR